MVVENHRCCGILVTVLLTFMQGCLDRDYNNPFDPDRENKGDVPDATPTRDGGDPVTGCVAADCASGTVFDFASVFETTPDGCDDAMATDVFEEGAGLRHFVLARCDLRQRLWFFDSALDGTNRGSPVEVSAACTGGTIGVKNFWVDRGSDGYFVAYVCSPAEGSFELKVATIAPDGTIEADAAMIEDAKKGSSHYDYSLTWSEAAQAFGLMRAGSFRRFDSQGQSLGGPIAATDRSRPEGLMAIDDGWLATHDDTVSKVALQGTLACNAVPSATEPPHRLVPIVGTTAALLGVYGTFENHSAMRLFGIDLTTCDSAAVTSLAGLTNRFDAALYRDSVTAAARLSQAVVGVLYVAESSLILATMALGGDGELHAEASVTGYQSALSARSLRVIGGKVYVPYAKDGKGYVSFSKESVATP